MSRPSEPAREPGPSGPESRPAPASEPRAAGRRTGRGRACECGAAGRRARRVAAPGILAAAALCAALTAALGCAAPPPPAPAVPAAPAAAPASAPVPGEGSAAPPRSAVAPAPAAPAGPAPAPVAPAPVELLASAELATGHRFGGTEVGGLSALALDPGTGDWLALSDDRGDSGPVRLYRLRLPAGEGGVPVAGGVELVEVLPLIRGGAPQPAGEIDPEGLVVDAGGMWIASEGVAADGVAPFVRRFGRDGAERDELPLPEAFLPTGDHAAGVRDNLGFEALTLTPDHRRLIAGAESALVQDGPEADFGVATVTRLVVWDLDSGEVAAQHLYPLDPVPFDPLPLIGEAVFRVNGLVELVALGGDRLLALERAFAAGRGNALRLYRVDLAGADDVSGVHSLAAHEASGEPAPRPAAKTPVADLGELLTAAGVPLDNVEAMAFGPDLPDGRRVLVMVSDNNFRPSQRTLFLAVAVAPSALE